MEELAGSRRQQEHHLAVQQQHQQPFAAEPAGVSKDVKPLAKVINLPAYIG